MLGDVNVQDAPPIMTHDEEAVEHTERNRWHCEEIHRGNRFPMVVKEGHPALGAVGIPRRSFHPTGNGSLGKDQSRACGVPHGFAVRPRLGTRQPSGKSNLERPSASVSFQSASEL